MSLGSQLAPHLPFLRRFGRALAGSQSGGDKIVRITLDGIVENPERFPQSVDPRLGLYRLFLDAWHADLDRTASSSNEPEFERIANARLSRLTDNAREALLLTAMEGFSVEDTGWLLDKSRIEVENLVSEALNELDEQTRSKVLIIEDEPLVAMDIETVVRELGHEVTSVSITHDEAVASALADPPGLIIADVLLADDSSGIDAVNDILQSLSVPVIYVTAFPERILIGQAPTASFLLTKPFQRPTLKAVISQALFFENATVPADLNQEMAAAFLDENAAGNRAGETVPVTTAKRDLRTLDHVDLQPLPSPIDAAVVAGRLRQVAALPVSTKLGEERVVTLWRLHAETANRISTDLKGANVGRAFTARLEAVREALDTEPSDNQALAIGVHSHGLARLLPTAKEYLLEDSATDLEAFLADLSDLARHFASYQEFIADAERAPVLPIEQAEALKETANALREASDRVVDPVLKESVYQVQLNYESAPDDVAGFALLRTVQNIVRGLGRYLRDISKASLDEFKDEIGSEIGKFAVRLVKSGVLLTLANFMPAGLSWVLTIAATMNILIGDDSKGADR